MKCIRLIFKNVVMATICLTVTGIMFSSCKKEEEAAKGWVKYQGKTHDLTQATARGDVLSVPGFEGTGFTVLLENSSNSDEKYVGLQFAFYSDASSLQSAGGTYTKSTGSTKAGTISNSRTQCNIGGTPFNFTGIGDGNEQVKVSYSDGKYTIEGFFDASIDGKVEFSYTGEVTIQK